MKELIIKKCEKCGALVEVLSDCTCENCGIKCCGEVMKELVPMTSEEAPKHLPEIEVLGDKIKVTFNHPMEEEHLIEYVWMVNGNRVCKQVLEPNSPASATFKYHKGSTIYSYCNKHGLWKKEVK